jgi:hypothetical protein
VSALVIVTCVAMTLLGIHLLRTGLHPPRLGHEPHCGRCHYNLTGNVSDFCPECGSLLSPGSVRIGAPWRSHRRIVTGMLCFIPLLPAAWLGLRTVDWYRFRPTAWLISDLNGADPLRAWTILDDRIRAGSLSESQRSRLIEMGLQLQGSSTWTAYRQPLINELGTWAIDGLMSEAQKDRFFEAITKFTLRVRPSVIEGDRLPYELKAANNGPTFLQTTCSLDEVLIDNRTVLVESFGPMHSNGSSEETLQSYLTCSGVGEHTLEMVLTYKLFKDPAHFSPPNGSTELTVHRGRVFEKTIRLTKSFKVLPPTIQIETKSDPAVTNAIQASIWPDKLQIGRIRSQQSRLTGILRIVSPPTDVAFDIFAKIHGQEYRLGGFCASRGTDHVFGIFSTSRLPPVAQCELILRSAPQLARETIDIVDAWQGEIVFKDVPIQLGAYATTGPE